MRAFVLLVCASGLALAQSTTTSYSTDINGRRVAEATRSASDSTRTEYGQSVNGVKVPLQQVQTRVLRQDANGSVTETITRKYDPTGQLISTQRVVTDQQKTAGGGSRVRATTYQTDINGQEQQMERRSTDTSVSGNSSSAQTVIERPGLSGSFQPVEKRTAVTQGTEASKTTTEDVYRAGQNGEFYQAVRNVETDSKSNGQTVQDTAEYELGATGDLRLHNRSVSTTTTGPGGQETTQVSLYSTSVPGTVRDPNAPQQLQEQQIITRQKAADGSVVETLSVRRPSVSDPTRLGELQRISQTVCTGKCDAR